MLISLKGFLKLMPILHTNFGANSLTLFCNLVHLRTTIFSAITKGPSLQEQ